MSCSIRDSLGLSLCLLLPLFSLVLSLATSSLNTLISSHSQELLSTLTRYLGCTVQTISIYCVHIFFNFYLLYPYILSVLTLVFSSLGYTLLLLNINIPEYFSLQKFSSNPSLLLPHTLFLWRCQNFSPCNPLVSL